MGSPQPRQSMRSTLRAATAEDHGRVDAFFRNGLRDLRDYRVYLRGFHAAIAGVAPALEAALARSPWARWPQRERVDALASDLRALGLTPLPDSRPPPLDGAAAAVGALYVIEGSALGARLLIEDVRGLGTDPAHGARFLHLHAGDAAARRWHAFVQCLEAAGFDAREERGMMAAAAAMFAYAEQEFTRARALETH